MAKLTHVFLQVQNSDIPQSPFPEIDDLALRQPRLRVVGEVEVGAVAVAKSSATRRGHR